MQVEQWEISKVIPYENNPRRNDEAVEKVANSIREFGWQQPIVVDKEGVVIVGHTRLKAAHELGLKEVPVLVAEELTDNQVKAYRLADNKTGELASWDWSQFNIELEDIDWLDINMEQFGFNELKWNEEVTDSAVYGELSDEELDEYSEHAKEQLKSYNVIICCLDDEEQEFMKKLIHEEDRLKRCYTVSELKERNLV